MSNGIGIFPRFIEVCSPVREPNPSYRLPCLPCPGNETEIIMGRAKAGRPHHQVVDFFVYCRKRTFGSRGPGRNEITTSPVAADCLHVLSPRCGPVRGECSPYGLLPRKSPRPIVTPKGGAGQTQYGHNFSSNIKHPPGTKNPAGVPSAIRYGKRKSDVLIVPAFLFLERF